MVGTAATEVKAQWIKLMGEAHITMVGKDVVCLAQGCHLLFYNVATGEEVIHMANGREVGDGVQCYTGHRILPILAFSEKSLNPDIIIIAYPGFEILTHLRDGAAEGYLSLNFSDGEFIVTLSDEPYHHLTIWNWRTNELIIKQSTMLQNPRQIIRCSFGSPVYVGNLVENSTDLNVWDIMNCYKKNFLIRHHILMPENMLPLLYCIWSPESQLLLLDKNGNVFVMTMPDYKLKMVINTDELGVEKPHFAWYKGGIIIQHANLKTVHYKQDTWTQDFEIQSNIRLIRICVSSNSETVIFWSTLGEMYKLDPTDNTIVLLKNYLSNFKNFDLVHPVGNVFITLSHDNLVASWFVKTGTNLCTLIYEDEISVLAANPVYPYVALGFRHGLLQLVSAFTPKDLRVLTEFHLYKKDITQVRFNETGNVIVTANLFYGLFFIICGKPGEVMEIIAYVDYRRTVIDFAPMEKKWTFQIYILVLKEGEIGSNRIVVKTISKSDGRIKKQKFLLDETSVLADKDMHSPATDQGSSEGSIQDLMVFYAKKNDYYAQFSSLGGHFYARPSQSKTIRVIELTKKRIRVKNTYHTGHLMRNINMQICHNHVTTCGYDGLITIRTLDLTEVVAVFMPHHRMDTGVRKVIVDNSLQYCISQGFDGTLVCTHFVQNRIETSTLQERQALRNEYINLFTGAKTIGFIPEGVNEGKTYLEVKHMEQVKEDQMQCLEERKLIYEQFLEIKKEVQELFEENIRGPELEKIDVLEFYLHSKLRWHKENQTDLECEFTRNYCKELMYAQDKVADWIRKQFWDTMLVKRTYIMGICANFEVENYIILPDEKIPDIVLKRVRMQRNLEELLRKDDIFLPWTSRTESSMNLHLMQEPVINKKDEETRILEALEEEEGEEEKPDKSLQSYFASTAYNYIDTDLSLYNQEEVVTYAQTWYQFQLLLHETVEIRLAFNKKFDDMMSQKVREMNMISERNNRLRYILSELNHEIFTKDKHSVCYNILISDPEWMFKEIPEKIITVDKSEIGITPYISPSEQEILDREAAEAERIRLALLADDFKERALIKMMHGVLEIRWEDTLKRDIPKPKCMSGKQSEELTEDDIRDMLQYEDQVAFLNSERTRYKNMLEAEYNKLADTLREGVKKFNNRLRDLLLLKIKVESARNEENFRILRVQLFTHTRNYYSGQERLKKEAIKKVEHKTAISQKLSIELLDACMECKAANEALIAKDKLLEKNFKKDFSDCSPLVLDQITKLYKKHPRGSVRGINTVSVLHELGSCVANHEQSVVLTQECLDYLHSVDILDQYVGVPSTIDEAMYMTLCRHRRLKLENEIRLKANAVEQMEVDNTIAIFQKRVAYKKDLITQITAELAQVRADKLSFIHNRHLQIVIKNGFVEIPMNGLVTDFKDAILICRKEVEDINKIILKAGERKLKVMRDKMIHRRGILMKEWEHKCMKMEIEDLENYLHLVDSVKVTKEIQQYLRLKAKGVSVDKGMLTIDQEIEMVKNSYMRIIQERKEKVNNLEIQIKEYTKKNKQLDKQIAEINIDVCEQQLNRDLKFEKQDMETSKNRMAAIVKRNKLVKLIQEQHNEILVLQTELELLRLKTYPTLKFKTIS